MAGNRYSMARSASSFTLAGTTGEDRINSACAALLRAPATAPPCRRGSGSRTHPPHVRSRRGAPSRVELDAAHGGIPQHADAARLGDALDQQLDPLPGEVGKVHEQDRSQSAPEAQAVGHARRHQIGSRGRGPRSQVASGGHRRLQYVRPRRHEHRRALVDRLGRPSVRLRAWMIGACAPKDRYAQGRRRNLMRASASLTQRLDARASPIRVGPADPKTIAILGDRSGLAWRESDARARTRYRP